MSPTPRRAGSPSSRKTQTTASHRRWRRLPAVCRPRAPAAGSCDRIRLNVQAAATVSCERSRPEPPRFELGTSRPQVVRRCDSASQGAPKEHTKPNPGSAHTPRDKVRHRSDLVLNRQALLGATRRNAHRDKTASRDLQPCLGSELLRADKPAPFDVGFRPVRRDGLRLSPEPEPSEGSCRRLERLAAQGRHRHDARGRGNKIDRRGTAGIGRNWLRTDAPVR